MDHVRILLLQGPRLAILAQEKRAVSIEIGFDYFFSSFGVLGLVNGAYASQLVFGDGARSHGAIPGDWSLANVALEGSEVGGRVDMHGDDGEGHEDRGQTHQKSWELVKNKAVGR